VLWNALKPEVIQMGIRYQEETGVAIAYHLSPSEHDLYTNPLAGWEAVVEKFPAAADDLEEAGRCLALQLPTAAVFHLMRVNELGLYTVATAVNAKYTNPNGNDVLKAIDDALKALLSRVRLSETVVDLR
jgi:hypothetical protein